ncbi:hypothetical protein INT46_007460 [Mucor plumbeus]|uniref:Zn(2)-C6 fungal-type domain-containing protein n=1 Tax=Mucor plumbeus TaxID=97098 RepID=A0A8H7V3C5_9FUNG|nr:hypothetical protein INT46_007460 [Mucor plumbeus]
MQSMPYYQQQQGYQPQAPYQAQPQAPNVLNNGPMMSHPNGLPPMQHPGITDQSQQAVAAGSQQAPKRKQVKNACTNCQKACKKCDDARPCPRCIKYGIAETCVNSVRKERKKGIKRGPYKRRQKTGEEKPRKNAAEMNTPDQNGQPTQYAPAMRGPAMPFGYPSNLNQYGQHYDPYGQYANYHKDQMMPQPYVVNPVYPPMGYPVIVPGGDNNGQQQQQQQQQQQPGQQQPQYQHNNYMMHQGNPQQAPRPPMMSQHGEHVMHQSPAGSPQVYYQPGQPQQGQPQQQQPQQQQTQQQHSQPPSQRNSPHLSEAVKTEPVPSASTSTNTTSSPDSGN